MHCPSCAADLNDDHPACPKCKFTISDLDAVFGAAPPRDGAVVDLAGALAATDRDRLTARLGAFADATGLEMIVAVVQSTAPRLPAEYAFWLFNRWRIGGPRHGGILVLLALDERRIETEVGFTLEGILSDAAAGEILETHAVPFFKADRYGEGLFHACDVLAHVFAHGAEVPA